MDAETKPEPKRRAPPIERAIEQTLFASRWLLAPIFVGLGAGLVVLLIKFVMSLWVLVNHLIASEGSAVILGVLDLVDVALMGGLVLMVMFAGYESFVSNLDFDDHRDKPHWIEHVDFGDLKLKLMATIVAIAAIHVLENFMNLDHLSDRELAWAVGILLAFVVTAVLMAVMDRLTEHK